MKEGKLHFPAALLLLGFIAAAAFAGGCGGSVSAGPTASAGIPSGSASERAQAILGHAPTGLAKKIADRGSVLVADDADYPPQSSVDSQTGKLVGFDVDVAREMGKILGLKVDFTHPSWETIPTGLQKGKYDVSIGSMAITPQRATALDFTEPYYFTPGQVFVKKGGPQIAGVKDLFGKTVGVGAATTYYAFLKQYPQIKVKTYTTDVDAFLGLRDGTLDFVMTAGPTGQQAILAGQPFAFSGKPLYFEDLAFAVRKGEADWLALLNYSLKQMHKDGSLVAMSKKWYYGLNLTVQQ